jgi:hypothetical protein
MSGQTEEAKAMADELAQRNRAQRCGAFNVAIAYAGFDEQRAMFWLDQALRQRDQFLPFFNFSPETDSLRRSPHGQEIIRAMGLR